MDQGCIKLFRRILQSQVFAHQTGLKIWVWCLCKATFKERFVPLKIGKGEITVKLLPGQFIFGRFKAEEELGIDGSTIYKWIQKFATPEYDMIQIESNNQYSIITLSNWEQYQIDEKKKVTTKEQPKNNHVTTEEQPKNTNNNDNNDNNVNNDKKKPDFDFQFLDVRFIPVFMEWIDYKKSRNEKYKTQKSLEACYRNLLRLANNSPDQAKLLIDQAMGNNWAGIFPLKTTIVKKDFGIPDKERDYTTPQKF